MRLQSRLNKLLGERGMDYNVEVKYIMFFRFLSSHIIQPEYFTDFSVALDEYCAESSLNCLQLATAFDYILKGMTSTRRTGAELDGWLTEPWAFKGKSRSVFFQNILVRHSPTLMNPLIARAPDDIVTQGFDFWSDPKVLGSIYRTFSMLLGWDWGLVGFIGSQDSVFIHRLNSQSSHEFNRAKQFMEMFSQFCEYRNLTMGSQSQRFQVIFSCLLNGCIRG